MDDCDLMNTTVNGAIGPLKSFLENLFVQRIIPQNPFYHVKYLPEGRGTRFIAFDQDEKTRISDHLKLFHPELYLFCNMIYTCFARPKEICALTPGDIDLQNDWIQIRKETSKVDHTSFRQIMPGMKKLLQDFNVLAMPKNQQIFASICGSDRNMTTNRRRVTDLWNKIVMKGLKIEKEMYGFKHTGNIDYLKSLDTIDSANLQWLKQQNDHTTLETTQKYIKDLGVMKMKKDQITFTIF